MNSILRYISVVAQPEDNLTAVTATSPTTTSPKVDRPSRQGCNYSDNYYGDQCCGPHHRC
jgi:hypothetical protein